MRHIGPPQFPQARTVRQRANELRRAKRAADKLLDYCLWSYVPGSREWYSRATADIRNKYGADADLFCDILAATSPQCDIVKNVALARDAFDRHKRRLPVAGWIPNHASNLERLRDGLPVRGPKVQAFARALKGDPDAIVVDTWMLKACGFRPGLWHSGTRVAHETVRLIAKRMGWRGAETQAAVWCGFRADNWQAKAPLRATFLEV